MRKEEAWEMMLDYSINHINEYINLYSMIAELGLQESSIVDSRGSLVPYLEYLSISCKKFGYVLVTKYNDNDIRDGFMIKNVIDDMIKNGLLSISNDEQKLIDYSINHIGMFINLKDKCKELGIVIDKKKFYKALHQSIQGEYRVEKARTNKMRGFIVYKI